MGNANLLEASITYSGDGYQYVLYNSGQFDTGSLRMINNNNTTGILSDSAVETVVSGINGNLTNAAATNGGIPWAQQAVRTSNGVLAVAYVSPGNYFSVTTCGD
ncbi:MAG: hypothetical protein ACOYOK_01420 [Pseudobdellovibrionaceae bacterium]